MLNTTINEWVTYLGYPPDGVFMYQPDTCSANFLKANGVNYVMGYCFDQYQVDWMSERGGWQLPYYANSKQSLMPENESAQGIVILPWLTWDWVDSFTLNHLFESETIGCAAENDTDYVISLSDATLASSEPFGYYAYSFEFGWLYAVGALDDAGAVLDYFISNQTYQKYSCGNFTHWFRNIYSITPTYHVNFSSPNSGDQVEWYYDAKSRIARHDGVVVSYVDYTDQLPDQYLTNAGNLDLSVSVSNINCIDNSLNFKIDALGGGQYRAPAMGNGSEYSEELSKFPQYYSVPSSEPAHASGNLFSFNNVCLSSAVASVLVISVLSCVAWFKKRKRSLT